MAYEFLVLCLKISYFEELCLAVWNVKFTLERYICKQSVWLKRFVVCIAMPYSNKNHACHAQVRWRITKICMRYIGAWWRRLTGCENHTKLKM